MKNASKVLIYDNDCPLCKAYTSAFVQTGLLPLSGRQHFNTVDPDIFKLVDLEKCNNEIPLVDVSNKKVWYGIDALLEIIGEKIPVLKKWGNFPPIKWFLQRLYKLISYNRKVIVAIPATNGYDCSPQFQLFYRVILLLLLLGFQWKLLGTLSEINFLKTTLSAMVPYQLKAMYLVVVSSFIVAATCKGVRKGMELMGQFLMTTSIGWLLFLPLYFMQRLGFSLSLNLEYFYVGILSLFMYREAKRRWNYFKTVTQIKMKDCKQ